MRLPGEFDTFFGRHFQKLSSLIGRQEFVAGLGIAGWIFNFGAAL